MASSNENRSASGHSEGHGDDDTPAPDTGTHHLMWDNDLDEDDDADENDPDYADEPDEEADEEDDFIDHDEMEFLVSMDSDAEDEEADDDGDGEDGGFAARAQALLQIIQGGDRSQLVALLQDPEISSLLFRDNAANNIEFVQWRRRPRRQPKDPNRFPTVPSEKGIELMRTGDFGANNYNYRVKKRLPVRMLEREIGLGNREDRIRNNGIIAQSLIPTTKAEQIVHFDDPVYSGQFSDDGNFFFACAQDFKVRMYDTSNVYNWKHYKTVSYPWGQWTLTDASLSPDNKWLAYTSIQSMVSIAPTDPNDTGDPYTLDLDDGVSRRGWRGRQSFGIWSVRFSGDGRELVAGTSAESIVVYDIERRTVLHTFQGHEDDVNAVCFGDKMSPHIIFSGSDDTTIKMWDRRSLGDGREAGAFVGHIEGLTYIDSKGDGRYIISNGKDQSMKLWDVRNAMTTAQYRQKDPMAFIRSRQSDFDYRRGSYDVEEWDPHPHDNSVVTFRGHKVLRTLIRCHFSPPNSSNSRYVYSGSADGKVYIWNMDATLAGVIDVRDATKGSRYPDGRLRLYHDDEGGGWATCVRDASWHPHAPVLVASAWNGYHMARGTCTLHSFNESDEDEGTSGFSYTDELGRSPQLIDRG